MRLFLAVAVLMLALVAYTEAQDSSEEVTTFVEKVSEISHTVAEKAKTTFDNIRNSDVVVNTREWVQDRFQQIKDKFQ